MKIMSGMRNFAHKVVTHPVKTITDAVSSVPAYVEATASYVSDNVKLVALETVVKTAPVVMSMVEKAIDSNKRTDNAE